MCTVCDKQTGCLNWEWVPTFTEDNTAGIPFKMVRNTERDGESSCMKQNTHYIWTSFCPPKLHRLVMRYPVAFTRLPVSPLFNVKVQFMFEKCVQMLNRNWQEDTVDTLRPQAVRAGYTEEGQMSVNVWWAVSVLIKVTGCIGWLESDLLESEIAL